ncbi:DeoR/GlpR family DNA-binding transcription regulator [Neorhizobium galegae]|uniref:DeoR/GlpR family DNA-binding transcription regulator n=1 Tax=Neorhizobium galegae TaxID=399 RepID=UPI000621CE71|nr:DeoR/GlpR family DNA-binding transcription regulator [Neorhizobium galegae]KAB1122295.1 DeoR/GlpR transcriptional regulator [Neorhizobium galegae]MCQ1805759.1 DeoR/GlpR family DNA-binding transcription regulator [Neorhizobium galegae]CDZ58055.1 DNA-binding transcriptional repressor GlpR [Neorhizobium galegae bv. orientalis]
MKPAARREEILRLLDETGEVTVEDLAERFDASRETIRRDLSDLDTGGHIRKFHGGARALKLKDASPHESEFDTRMKERKAEKTAIARKAATLFPEGSVLFIDTGSTTIAFAQALAKRRNMTVITNSPQIARIMAQAEMRHHVYLVGGEIAAEGRETLGAMATAQIAQFKAEHVVLTVGAITATAVMDYDLRETEMARAMIAQAQSITVLADHAKLGRPAVFQVAGLSQVASLITDRMPDPEMAAALAAAGVDIVVADPDPS